MEEGTNTYGEEALAGKDAALWLQEEILSVEYAGETLSTYEVNSNDAGSGPSRLREVTNLTLFETPYALRRLRLFDLAEALGDEGWMKVLRLDDYAARRPRQPETLQQMLFLYTEAI